MYELHAVEDMPDHIMSGLAKPASLAQLDYCNYVVDCSAFCTLLIDPSF